jgi:hypothetical protein
MTNEISYGFISLIGIMLLFSILSVIHTNNKYDISNIPFLCMVVIFFVSIYGIPYITFSYE